MATTKLLVLSLVLAVLLSLTGCPSSVPVLRLVFAQGNYGDDGYVSIVDGIDHAPSPQTAERFVLEEGRSEIRVVQWWGTQDPAISHGDQFIVRIFEDDGSGLPMTFPLYAIPANDVVRVYTGRNAKPEAGSPPIYEYSVELMPFALTPDVPYYLSIVNAAGHDWIWMWTDDSGLGEAYSRSADDEAWTSALTHNPAFCLWR